VVLTYVRGLCCAVSRKGGGDESGRMGSWRGRGRGNIERSLCSGLRLFLSACSQNEEAIATVIFCHSIDTLYLHRATKPPDWSY
jgi:hypothetical protein